MGRPAKIDDAIIEKIFACLNVGASLKDAAGYVGINVSTLHRLRKKDRTFATGIVQAVQKGKIHHLNKIGKATSWQASAWMLERRWGQQFGRKEHITQEHKGKIKTEGPLDFDKLTPDELRTYIAIAAKASRSESGEEGTGGKEPD